MTNSPTPGPTPAPTTAWELLDNRFYLGGGLTVLAVVLLTVVVFYDMDPHQRKRVGLENITALNFACVDFVGDVMWMSVRLYRGGRDPEDYPASVSYGVASLIVLVFATAAGMFVILKKVLGPHRAHLTPAKLESSVFISVLLLSFTNPDCVMLFPWTDAAYKLDKVGESTQSPFPNRDALSASYWRLAEDIPQFMIMLTFSLHNGADPLTIANLVLTIIVILYMAIGKCLTSYLAVDDEDGVEMHRMHTQMQARAVSARL